jgi:hypothetical protein
MGVKRPARPVHARLLAQVPLGIDELRRGRHRPSLTERAIGVGDVCAAAPRSIAAKQRVHDRLGRVEPDLGPPVVLQAGQGVEKQQGLIRGARRPPRANWRMPSNLASKVARSSGTAAGVGPKAGSDIAL